MNNYHQTLWILIENITKTYHAELQICGQLLLIEQLTDNRNKEGTSKLQYSKLGH